MNEPTQNEPVVPSITPEGARARLTGGSRTILVDVRSFLERMRISIPGSRHIPMKRINMHVDELKGYDTVIVFCATDARSAHAVDELRGLSVVGAVNLEGGIVAWKKAKLPVRHGHPYVLLFLVTVLIIVLLTLPK